VGFIQFPHWNKARHPHRHQRFLLVGGHPDQTICLGNHPNCGIQPPWFIATSSTRATAEATQTAKAARPQLAAPREIGFFRAVAAEV